MEVKKVSVLGSRCMSCIDMEKLVSGIEGFKIMNPNGRDSEVYLCKRMMRGLSTIEVDGCGKNVVRVPDVCKCDLYLQKGYNVISEE